jgi:iron complex outermembrane recepter protein
MACGIPREGNSVCNVHASHGGKRVSNDKPIAAVFPRRRSVTGLGFLLGLLFSGQAWAQAPPANQVSQPQPGPAPQSISEPQQNCERQQASLPKQASQGQQSAPTSEAPPGDLTQVSIENLMNMEVTSASKKEQKLSSVAAAIFVITQEDIRNSGATNIPDLLRMVPGLDVAQINANTWAISSRGFNLQFANKLLVLIDGRAVYTPLFGGVNWDTQDVPLEDIERIEVIRGPGGTVWGANAVNGVINIITKKAAETQGGLVTGGGGTQAQEFGTLQYGGKIKEDSTYRVFTKYLNNDHLSDLNGQNGEDGWHLLHGGFRVDTKLSESDSLTTQGDIYTGDEGSIIVHSVLAPVENINVQRQAPLSGGDVFTRWDHTVSSRSDIAVQFYFDRYTRGGPESTEHRDTIDFDFQNHIVLGTRQDLIWGAGYQHSADQTTGTIDQAFSPANESGELFSAFVQDQINLEPNQLALYVGTKLENSYFSGFDYEPSARIAWTPSARRTFWAAVSRASRTPTQRDIGINAVLAALPGSAEVTLLGNPNIQSEHVVAYELGFRAQASDRFSLETTVFFNDYRNLESADFLAPFFDPDSVPPVLIHPESYENKMYGTTEGIEVYAKWKATKRWTISPGYSFLEMHLHTQSSSLDSTSVADAQGSNPGHQAQLRSQVELSNKLRWDTSVYFVDRLPAQFVASYTRLDSELTWRLAEQLTLSATGQNLLKDHHVEFNDQFQSVNSSEVKRSVYAKFTWRF